MDTKTKVFENRVRRMAQRQGWHMSKTRRRDHRATDYATYELRNEKRTVVGMTLDQVHHKLTVEFDVEHDEGQKGRRQSVSQLHPAASKQPKEIE